MKKQLILIFLFTIGLALIEACSCFTSCGCGGAPEPLAYFDFEKLKVQTQQNIGVETLRLTLEPDSIEYLAVLENTRPIWPGWVTSAYACSPVDPGFEGLKFPVSRIQITANQAFNDTIPAGASLNSLFQMATNPNQVSSSSAFPSSQLTHLNDLVRFQPLSAGPYSALYLVTREMPQNPSIPLKFTITLTKIDSTTVSVVTNEISF